MKKTLAFFMAFAIVLGLTPDLFNLEVQAAAGDRIEIHFVGDDVGVNDNLTANVIRGSSIGVAAKNTDNSAIKTDEDAMYIVKPETGGSPAKKNPYFELKGDKSSLKITPILKNKLPPNTFVDEAASGSYDVSTNYISYQKTASTFQTLGNPGSAAGTFVLEETNADFKFWIPVHTNSTAKLRYTAATSTTSAKWTLTTEENTAGVFAGYKTEVGSGDHVARADATSPPESYTLTLYNKVGGEGIANSNRVFKFYPNIYWEKVTAITNPDGTSGTRREPQYNMNTEVDNEFDITFNFASSNPLVLTVNDPRTVLEGIVGEATNNNPLDNDYVKLAAGTSDQYSYITTPFKLKTTATMHREKINLSWVWDPVDSGVPAQKVMDIRRDTDTEQKVFLNPLEKDAKGVLRVVADYTNDNLDEDVMFGKPVTDVVVAELPVIVHGLGKPAYPDYVTKTTGGVGGAADVVDASEVYGEGKHLPSAIYNMDVYKNGVNGFTPTERPYKLDFTFNAGKDNGATQRLIIDAEGAKDAVAVTVKTGPPGASGGTEYKFGDNFDGIEGAEELTVTVVALKEAPENLNLTFRFFVAGINNSLREEPLAQEKVNIGIGDSSPDTTAELESLKITDQEGKTSIPDFVFDPKKYDYTSPIVEVPNEMSVIRIKPNAYVTTQSIMGYKVERMNADKIWVDVTGDGGGDDAMAPSTEKKWIEDWGNPLPEGQRGPSITTGKTANRIIRLIPDVPMRVTIKVRAQDPNIVKAYTLILRRQLPSTDSSLKMLTVVNTANSESFSDGFTPTFAPDIYSYDVVVPYHVEEIRAEFDTTHPKAVGKQIEPAISLLSRMFGKGTNVKLLEDGTPVEIKIQVQSQSDLMPVEPWWDDEPPVADSGNPGEEYKSTYVLRVSRARPGTDATLTSLAVSDKEDKPLTYTPAFNPDTEVVEYYELPVPYSVDKIRLTAATTHKYASMVASGEGFSDIELKSGKASKLIDVKWYESGDPYIITITATAEDKQTVKQYKLHLLRAAPSTDASLASLAILDQEGKALPEFSFNTETTDYQISVPYEIRKVTFTPKATNAFVKLIEVDGRKVVDGQPSQLITLPEYPNVKTVVVEVTAEDGTTKMSYRVTISRQQPSSDARLALLSATNIVDNKLSPNFAPKTLNYTATLIETADGGTAVSGITVTGITASPYATLTIDGKKAISGTASEQIAILDETQAVLIVVTAQDGKTTSTYRISFTNPNLVPKSSNADLARLKVNYGEMAPGFKPSITNYEVYAKEDEYSVDIMPRAADKGAEVKVFAGSKEIGDENGNFAQSIADGENDFLVRVTSSDKTKIKEYSVLIYRNEEDKQGSLKPITADDIDYENSGDVIIVDITKYSRVAANVFTELKNYPEKTIIFEGNDYSLQFSAAELDKVIPGTAVYDFKMSFNSPIADEIYDEIDRYRSNRRADTVLVHFGYDGTLPGPCTLTMSLGKRYRNDTYYWHYYNEERGRLDYYGSFKTNSKGTFTVPLEHMSTYVIAEIKLYGSEDKSGGILDIGEQAEIEKLNPDTGTLGGNR